MNHTLSQKTSLTYKSLRTILWPLVFLACLLPFYLSCSQEKQAYIPNIQFLSGAPLPEAPTANIKAYRFTENMFAMRNRIFWQALSHLKDQPNIHYLEIGVYEGRALLWILEHITTHPSSTLTGIDLFASGEGIFQPKEVYKNPNDFKQRYFHNIRSSGQESRIQTHIGFSQDVLKTLRKNHYDIIYIDGCHTLACTREDTTLSWARLKPGGILMIDDYSTEFPDVYQAAQELYTQHQHDMEVLHTGWVLVVKKIR